MHEVVDDCVWVEWMFRHAGVVCWCHVCIPLQFLVLHSA